MVTTLKQAGDNTNDDLDMQVINEFRRSSQLLDALSFKPLVNPIGGGATLSYTYRRQVAEMAANFRRYNHEFSVQDTPRSQRFSVDLHPLGGKFAVDRRLAHLGPALTDEVSMGIAGITAASKAKFQYEFIHGVRLNTDPVDGDIDVTTDEYTTGAFDGIDAAVTGTITEYGTANNGGTVDWTTALSGGDRVAAIKAAGQLNDWLYQLQGTPTCLLANRAAAVAISNLAQFGTTNLITTSTDEFGRFTTMYQGIPIWDLKQLPNSNADVIPIDGSGNTTIYAVDLNANTGVWCAIPTGTPLIQTWEPDFSFSGAVKHGEVEMAPVAPVISRTRSAGAFRVKLHA